MSVLGHCSFKDFISSNIGIKYIPFFNSRGKKKSFRNIQDKFYEEN